MKYKVGDKVRIKTWEEMVSEYGLDVDGDIKSPFFTTIWFSRRMETILKEEFSDRILVIKEAYDDLYVMEGITSRWKWKDYMIKELVIKEMYIILEPIESRFELMEL